MQMLEFSDLSISTLFAGLAGLVLGAYFFGSLWWVVRRTLSSPPSLLWHLGSVLIRTGVTLLGFYAVGGGHWERLLACLVGFFAARLAATWMTRAWERRQTDPKTRMTARKIPEAGHAPQP